VVDETGGSSQKTSVYLFFAAVDPISSFELICELTQEFENRGAKSQSLGAFSVMKK
jgi:hypothetical protein